MASYEELRRRSLNFVRNLLISSQSATLDFHFFKMSMPTAIPLMDIEQVKLIEATARLLPDYYGADVNDDVKKSVLIGMYCYVEIYYHSRYTAKLYQPLFNQIHTEIGELSLLERQAAIINLQYFCKWIIENLTNPNAQKLWEAMPLDMQIVLEKHLNVTDNEASPFWSAIDNVGRKVTEGWNTMFK